MALNTTEVQRNNIHIHVSILANTIQDKVKLRGDIYWGGGINSKAW